MLEGEKNKKMTKVVAVTGASNGMGFEAAKLFAQKGFKVYAGARRVEKIPSENGIVALELDVTNSKSNHQFIDAILEKEESIDVLVNNAGYGEYGPVEEISIDIARKQFETNFFGAAELATLVIPLMREKHYGRIINISSIGGDIYTPLGAYYHATKAALQQWSDVLDMEVSQFGIRSIIVQPGGTKSAWAEIAVENARKNLKENSPYLQTVNKLSNLFSTANNSGNAPTSRDLAEVFYKAATDNKPKFRYFKSFSDRALVHTARTHPRLYKRIFSLVFNRFLDGNSK